MVKMGMFIPNTKMWASSQRIVAAAPRPAASRFRPTGQIPPRNRTPMDLNASVVGRIQGAKPGCSACGKG